MNLGQLLGGAGVVGSSMRAEEDAQRQSRQKQLQTDEMNRLDQLRQEMLRAPMPTPQVPQFAPGGDGGMLPVRFIEPPAAPVAPAAAPVAGTQPAMQARPGAPDQSAVESARLARSGTPTGGALTPDQIRQGYNRTALAKVPAAIADIAQLPTAVGLNVLGAGARGINYLFGTELPEKSFSLTPFYDRYVRQPEQALERGAVPMTEQERFAELQRKNAPAAAPAAPSKPTKTALSYDNKATPYDAVIQQSAQQYGIDPVVFKRLIGTESSFNPQAVSPRGERFGLGIAQIAAVHGLTREQMLDPNVAIPFAAQLFSQMVQQTGGNVEEALMRYKGATSEKGRTAMSKPIGDILSGLIPTAQAAAPAAAPAAAAAAAAEPIRVEVSGTSQFYLANPQSIPMDMQRAMQQRAEVERLAGMFQRAGMGTQFMEARAKLLEADNSMTYLQGMQGLQEFTLANDPRRLAAVWSQYAGVPVGIQPRTDGKFDIIVNGRKTKEGMSASMITDSARSAFDQTYRQQKSAASSKYNEEQFKAQLEIQKENAKQLSQMIREVAVQRVQGNTQLAVEQLKQFRYDVKPTGAGDGTVVITPPGSGVPYLFNPSGRTIEVDGVKITSNAAYPISGLPSYGGVKP